MSLSDLEFTAIVFLFTQFLSLSFFFFFILLIHYKTVWKAHLGDYDNLQRSGIPLRHSLINT